MKLITVTFLFLIIACSAFAQEKSTRVTISNGQLEGRVESSGIHSFKGIPFAQPPVGELRWKAPQPVVNWKGIRKATSFGNQPMQKKVFADMQFRSAGTSEDCLYLNIWSPNISPGARLPVLVYFYGGGFVAGDGSEPRYDGESMAARGIVALTVNYRLGVFGFFSHPELTKESPYHGSGNYGLLDQNAALRWVQQNIEKFGGDPGKVTIAGESAGSISVSAHMASPLSKNLFARAIGESGAMIHPTLPALPLAEAEKNGEAFAKKANVSSLQQLRSLSAQALLDAASQQNAFNALPAIDGYFLPESPEAIFEAGEQSKVPLLAGWNSAELPYTALMWGDQPTPENYVAKLQMLFGERSGEALKLYPGASQKEVIQSATAIASDRFIVYSTWKWAEQQRKFSPVYLYIFSRQRPPDTTSFSPAPDPPLLKGAAHAVEIEYAMGNLKTNRSIGWTQDDFIVSTTMQAYFANFIITGNPNGDNLPEWPASSKKGNFQIMNIDVESRLENEKYRERYLFLDKEFKK